jgi:rod shape-determining protein MreD
LVSAIVLQASLFSEIRFFGISADVLLLLTIAAGMTVGPDRGAAIGFAAGLLMDLLLVSTPFGLSALTYCLVGYATGLAQGFAIRVLWWFPVLTAAAASAAGVMLFVLLGEVMGEQLLTTPGLWKIVTVVSVVNAVLIVPANRLLRWCFRGGNVAKAQIA